MPNIKQQIKRMRKSEEQRSRNRSIKSSLKTRIKKFESAIAAGEKESATAEFKLAACDLDRAVSKGVIHKNKAANKKSRMARSLNSLL